jgi:hypothetical protein
VPRTGKLFTAVLLPVALPLAVPPVALVALVALPAVARAAVPLPAGGFGQAVLRLTTSTDTLPGSAAAAYLAAPGAPVRRDYTVTNASEATIDDVRVHDSDAGTVACDGARLPAWSSAHCTVVFAAVPGNHLGQVTATGAVYGVDTPLSASAPAGYRSAADTLTLTETLNGQSASPGARVPVGQVITAGYRLAVSGPVPVRDVRLSDSAPVAGLRCGPDGGPDIRLLMPGQHVACTGGLRAAPGTHIGTATVTGTQDVGSITTAGPAAGAALRATDANQYTGTSAPPPVTSPPAPTQPVTPPPVSPPLPPPPPLEPPLLPIHVPPPPRPAPGPNPPPAPAPAGPTPVPPVPPYGSPQGPAGAHPAAVHGATGALGSGRGSGLAPAAPGPRSHAVTKTATPARAGAAAPGGTSTGRHHPIQRQLSLLLLLVLVIVAPVLGRRLLHRR